MSLHMLEFQPRIQAAHVFLSGDISAVDVSITPNAIVIKDHTHNADTKGKTICSWDSPNAVVFNSAIVKVVPQVGLYIRLKTSRDFSAEQIIQTVFSDDKREFKCSDVIKCRFCNCPLTETNNLFTRVLPLPSDAWNEHDAFCHGDHRSPTQLSPRKGDLLFGESVLLVHGSSLSSSSQLVDNHQIVCKRCHNIYGKLIMSSDTKLGLLCEMKFELQRSQAFRFKIANLSGKPYVSVWLMNSVSRIHYNTAGGLQETVLIKFTGEDSFHGAVIPDNSYVLKVMFKSHLGEEGVCVGVNEEVMKLRSDECLSLLLLLTHSNSILPPSQQTVHGYKIGLLSI